MKFGAADHLSARDMQRIMQCGVSASLANETRRAASPRQSETRNLKYCAVCLGAKLGAFRAHRVDLRARMRLRYGIYFQILRAKSAYRKFYRLASVALNLSRALEFAERDL